MTGIAEPIVNGFVLGITAGPLCFTGCFPMLFSIGLAEGQRSCSPAETWLFIGKFISGRFIAYLGFGLLVGYLGSQLGAWNHKIGIYSSMVMAFLLVAYGMGVTDAAFGPVQCSEQQHRQPILPRHPGRAVRTQSLSPVLVGHYLYTSEQCDPRFRHSFLHVLLRGHKPVHRSCRTVTIHSP